MIKKILPIMLCLCLIFSVSAIAANSTDNSNAQTPAAMEELPMQNGRQGGGRGGMGMPPGDAMPNGETPPAMPDGEMPPAMPEGEMTPPQDGGNAGTENGQQTQPSDSENKSDTTADTTNESSDRMQRGGMGGMNGGMQGNTQNTENAETASQGGILDLIKTYSTPITAVILLALAFVFVIFYKRNTY